MKSSNSANAFGDLVQIGKVTGVHGIGGTLKVYSYAESAECFAPRKQLVVVDSAGTPARFGVLRSQAHKSIMRLSLEGVTTRDQAEALIGADVFLAKSDLPPLAEDTYYWSDIVGMSVYTVDDDYLGRVEKIIPTGANDVYLVKTPADHAAAEILIPAIASVVIDIDVAQGRMRVDLPEGLV